MPRSFVTGATGFIGRHLVERLSRQGDEVRCLVRSPEKGRDLQHEANVQLVPGRVQSPATYRDALSGCDVVYHVAGLTSSIRTNDLWDVNVGGTERLLHACSENARRPVVVIVSSLSAAGPWVKRHTREIGNTARPISEYGRSKLAGDLVAAKYSTRLPISIVRPGVVFGERNVETLPMFRSVYRARVHAMPTFRPPRLSLIHQQDLIEVLLRVAQDGHRLSDRHDVAWGEKVCPGAEGVYFAGDPRHLSYAELGLLIGQAVGIPSPLMMHVPEPLLWLASALNAVVAHSLGRLDSFNPDKIREATAGDWIIHDSRLQRDLGFDFRQSLEQRFHETAQWYLSHGWL